jgi:uncharacterized membrane protein
MVAATLSLGGFFLALYLWLWKIGVIGSIACGAGTCEYVQTSRYATFLGLPVAFVGVGGYLSLFVVSLVGLQPRWIGRRAPTVWLAVLSGLGVAFTAYLTYLEAAVINAWCRWCLGSAGIIVAIFATAVVGLRAVRQTDRRSDGREGPVMGRWAP